MNIADEAPEFTPFGNSETTPWEFLTQYEQAVELALTPHRFRFAEHIHGPSSEDFGRTLKTDENQFVHLFFPCEFDDDYVYAHYYTGEVILEKDPENRNFKNPHLSSLELDWEISSVTLEKQIHTARLLIPSNNDVFHFFFG